MKQNTNTKRFSFKTERDPDAMDVDSLTLEERKNLMERGLCFNCRKTGHMSKDCPEKRNKNTGQNRNRVQRNFVQGSYKGKSGNRSGGGGAGQTSKYTGKSLHTHIRQLLANLDEEERNEFNDLAEEEGFY